MPRSGEGTQKTGSFCSLQEIETMEDTDFTRSRGVTEDARRANYLAWHVQKRFDAPPKAACNRAGGVEISRLPV